MTACCRLGGMMNISELKQQGLAGAKPRTRRRGLKLPATAHGQAAGDSTRAGQSRNGIFKRRKSNSSERSVCSWIVTDVSFLLASSAYSVTLSFMLSYLYQGRLEAGLFADFTRCCPLFFPRRDFATPGRRHAVESGQRRARDQSLGRISLASRPVTGTPAVDSSTGFGLP